MKKIVKMSLVLSFGLGLSFVSCKKKSSEPTPEDPIVATPVTPPASGGSAAPGTTFIGSDGVLIAMRSRVMSTYVISGVGIVTDIYSENAVAAINTNSTSSTLVDAGAITIQDSLLIKQSGNSYLFNKNNPNSTSNFTTFFNTGSKWSVAGNAANLVPSFTYTASSFPGAPLHLVVYDPYITAAYNISLTMASACDSLIFQVIGGNGTKLTSKPQPGNVTSFNFSATEMATLQKSSTVSPIPSGQVSVFAYKYYNTIVTGKKYWFVNIGAITHLINVQ